MKKFGILLAVAALLMIAGLGCSSKKKDDDSGGSGGVLTLTSYASPPGSLRENSELPMDVVLSCNRAGALIYYTSGGSPADPSTGSPIYDGTPLTIDTGYQDGTFIVKYFAWYKDPDTGNFEQECPPPDGFHTDTYMFKPDIKKPTVKIEPPGGAFGDPASVTITITASDPPNTPDTCTIYYETTDDGTDPPVPTTSSTSGPGDGTNVAWTGGTLKIAAIAVDAAGNQSANVARATFSIDSTQAVYIVLEKINDARELLGYDDLLMDPAFAGGCAAHCQVIWNAENGTGTLMIPSGKDSEGLIPYWYEETDNRQLIDWDDGDSIGFYITMLGGKTHFPMGMHAGSADEFFTSISGMANGTI